MSQNALNDGTVSGTVSNLAQILRFLAAVSDDPEMCDPGLHLTILMASQTAASLEKAYTSADQNIAA